MADELFAEVKSEGATLDIDKAFERLETKGETPSESQPEKPQKEMDSSSREDEKNTPSEEKTPFHKHPRWIKTQETLKQYEARIADFEKKLAEKDITKETVAPDWWKKAYGETEDSLKRYAEYESATQAERERLKAEVKADLQNEVKQDQKQVKDAEDYVDTQIEEMKAEGLTFEKNKLLKFMVDFQDEFGAGALQDSEGNYDFRKSFALMQKMEPEVPEENINKQLAGQASRSKVSAGTSSKIPVISTRALRKGGWREAGI